MVRREWGDLLVYLEDVDSLMSVRLRIHFTTSP